MREGCDGGGKGPLIQTEKSGTLGTGNDQTIVTARDVEVGARTAEPVVFDGANVTSKYNVQNPKPGDPCFTLSTDSRNYVVPTTYFLQGNGIDRADTAGCNGKGWREDVCYTLNTIDRPAVFSFDSLSSNSMKSSNPHSGCRQVEIAKCIDTTNPDPSKNQGGMAVVHGLVSKGNGEAFLMPEKHMSLSTGGGQAGQGYPAVFDARGNGDGSIAPTMTGDHQNRVTDYTGIAVQPVCFEPKYWKSNSDGVAETQMATQYKDPQIIAAVDCRNGTAYTANQFANYTEGVGTLRANGGDLGGGSESLIANQSVRRLTPLECERLQGFPDNWTDIPPQAEVTAEDLIFWRTVWDEWDDMNGKKRHTDKQIVKWLKSEAADSARYKALGNSIALPPWRFVLYRIRAQGAVTMGSLFDGIGGFPLIWNESGGQTLWASEIEPFCIAVTKHHFTATR
jgi:site-specific DNA-cytosine methylase